MSNLVGRDKLFFQLTLLVIYWHGCGWTVLLEASLLHARPYVDPPVPFLGLLDSKIGEENCKDSIRFTTVIGMTSMVVDFWRTTSVHYEDV